jgi:hypothetical protein
VISNAYIVNVSTPRTVYGILAGQNIVAYSIADFFLKAVLHSEIQTRPSSSMISDYKKWSKSPKNLKFLVKINSFRYGHTSVMTVDFHVFF